MTVESSVSVGDEGMLKKALGFTIHITEKKSEDLTKMVIRFYHYSLMISSMGWL